MLTVIEKANKFYQNVKWAYNTDRFVHGKWMGFLSALSKESRLASFILHPTYPSMEFLLGTSLLPISGVYWNTDFGVPLLMTGLALQYRVFYNRLYRLEEMKTNIFDDLTSASTNSLESRIEKLEETRRV